MMAITSNSSSVHQSVSSSVGVKTISVGTIWCLSENVTVFLDVDFLLLINTFFCLICFRVIQKRRGFLVSEFTDDDDDVDIFVVFCVC